MERATVIVALPPVDDRIQKRSSEEVPHLTLLYLGDVELSAEAVLYVQHATKELSPFGMSVDYRGTLGEDEADVLFFEKTAWDMERISSFRHHLLLNDEIKRAYDAAPQHTEHPDWTPHLTLGYPATPAPEDDEDRRIYYVDFDRIAVWTGDFEGPEFRLKYAYLDDVGVMAMSDISTAERGSNAVAEMFHYGKKGMRWGVTTKDRAKERTPVPVTTTQKKEGKFVKSKGGQNLPAHQDAITALVARQKAKASTTDSLSNAELKTAVERMQLEQKYSQLSFSNDRRSRGARFISGLFGARKPTKFTDMHEESGEQVRNAIRDTLAESKRANAA